MKTFEEFQSFATKVPLALRNNRDRIDLPVTGLQQEAGKVGALLAKASASGQFKITPEQRGELKERDILWYTAVVCHETEIPMQEVAAHGIAQLQDRASTSIQMRGSRWIKQRA